MFPNGLEFSILPSYFFREESKQTKEPIKEKIINGVLSLEILTFCLRTINANRNPKLNTITATLALGGAIVGIASVILLPESSGDKPN